jgi:hypothetical protein
MGLTIFPDLLLRLVHAALSFVMLNSRLVSFEGELAATIALADGAGM